MKLSLSSNSLYGPAADSRVEWLDSHLIMYEFVIVALVKLLRFTTRSFPREASYLLTLPATLCSHHCHDLKNIP